MKILGIPTKVDPSFFVIVLFLAAGRSASLLLMIEWLLVVFVSVLLHELGHALTVRKFGASPSIVLYAMGGLTSWQSEIVLTPLKRLLVSLAGPATGFLFGGIIYALGPTERIGGLLGVAYRDLLWVNIGWGIFNLLPLIPLDGGHVLLALEEWLLRKKSQIISHIISLLVALTIVYLAISYHMFWIAILGGWFTYSNAAFLIRTLKGRLDRTLEGELEQARDAVEREDYEQALQLIHAILQQARSTELKRDAHWLLIFVLMAQENLQTAETELIKYEGLYGEEPYILGVFYFKKGDMTTALPYLRKAFVRSPHKDTGVLLARALTAEKKFVELFELIKQESMEEVRWELAVNLHNDSFADGEFRTSAKAAAMAFDLKRDPNTAYNAACAFARAGDEAEGLRWLEQAVEAGFSDRELVARDSDIDLLRSSPAFTEIVSKMS